MESWYRSKWHTLIALSISACTYTQLVQIYSEEAFLFLFSFSRDFYETFISQCNGKVQIFWGHKIDKTFKIVSTITKKSLYKVEIFFVDFMAFSEYLNLLK